MRVAIIGAGAAGLTSAKYAKEKGIDCVVFEQCSQLGGVWVYTDYTDLDEYGYPVHSAMYKGLRTNLPKEIMGFSDLNIPDNSRSYLNQEEILEFLHLYADVFNLKPLIKFNTIVRSVKHLDDGTWRIETEDKIQKRKSSDEFDAVMVCTGHYSTPNIPNIPGMETFKGTQIHSKAYRRPETYKGQNVMVVGGGPSGVDLVLQLSEEVVKVFFSHCNALITSEYPENVIMKPIVQDLKENKAIFADGSSAEVHAIIYCTGYLYNFPFLDSSCNIIIEDNHIQHLYKHIINISHPTMAFIGMPFNVCTFQLFDLQARFFIHSLTGEMKLPSVEDMMLDAEMELKDRLENGYKRCEAHKIGSYQRKYYSDLATLAKTKDIPQVMISIKACCDRRNAEHVRHFRNDLFKIVDDEKYIHILT